jgi:5-methylcytosine-specific restriction endonuclease McrA
MTVLGAELDDVALLLDYGHDQKRFPVKRTKFTEARAPIDYQTRLRVYVRDHSRCRWCGSGENLTLDHVVPWSAGGSDQIENLRTLCWDYNGRRSNFLCPDDLVIRTLPITFCCADCPDVDGLDPLPLHHPGMAPAFCWWCKQPSVGIPSQWFAENNAVWDYDLNWHRENADA